MSAQPEAPSPFEQDAFGGAPAFGVEIVGGVVFLALIGEHDVVSAPQLAGLIEKHGANGLVVSLREAQFIDSSIVRALFAADASLARRGRRLVLLLPEESPTERVLDLAGVPLRVPVTRTVGEAVEVAKTRPRLGAVPAT